VGTGRPVGRAAPALGIAVGVDAQCPKQHQPGTEGDRPQRAACQKPAAGCHDVRADECGGPEALQPLAEVQVFEEGDVCEAADSPECVRTDKNALIAIIGAVQPVADPG
jgi:hypothetical protein